MQMIMQSVDLCDDVTVTIGGEENWTCTCDIDEVPSSLDNLAVKAAEAFYAAFGSRPEGLHISIIKRIPTQGGMAGGSADAAAVLHALNTLHGHPYSLKELMQLGESVGSDVPYCVMGGTALAEGRGEVLTPLPPMPTCVYLLVRPRFSVSTPALFRTLDGGEIETRPDTKTAIKCLYEEDLHGFCENIYNVFQPVLAPEYPVVDIICEKLREFGALNAALTGTGSVVFGVFDNEMKAGYAAAKLEQEYTVFLAKNV